MAVDDAVAKAFGLQGDAWQRHANPWSVYTRIPIPALLVVAVVLLWTFVNPRAFPPPRSMDHWASRSVFGEKYWAARKERPIPAGHRLAPWVLTGLNVAGVPFVVWGLVVLNPWMTAFGLALHMSGKLWSLDRMALLYDDMKLSAPGSLPPAG